MYTWQELKTMENRFDIKYQMQEDVKTLETIYVENVSMYSARPNETIREYVAAVGYGRAAATVASLVNYSAWDGRINKKNAEWAVTVPGSIDDAACCQFDIYTNRIHMGHLNQLADVLRNFTPDETHKKHSETETPAQDAETPAERPETISSGAAPEAREAAAQVAPAEPEAQKERPETISEEEGMKKMKYTKVKYSTIGRYDNGMKYGILTRVECDGYIPEGMENIAVRKVKSFWHIDHLATGLAVGGCGYKTRDAAISDYKKNLAERVKDAETRMEKAVETFQAAPLDEEVAAWETVNYCTTRNYRFDKVGDAARRAGLLIQKADNNTYMDGGNINIIGKPEALKAIKEIIAEYEKHDAERAAEEAARAAALEAEQAAAQAEPEAVAALPEPETVAQAEPEAVEERPETISEEAAPEAVETVEAEPVPEADIAAWPAGQVVEVADIADISLDVHD